MKNTVLLQKSISHPSSFGSVFGALLFLFCIASAQPIHAQQADTLRILAVLVEFQVDVDKTTVGDGTFNSIYTGDYGKDILDPLPHNAAYFSAHLEFAKRYFEKSSRGKQPLAYTVLPQVITVSKTMKGYSPDINSTDFLPVAEFSSEVWTLANQQYPDIDFSKYDLFTIFHAGVSRSVSLPGSLGNERDLPSLYFSLASFQKYFGADYAGIPVDNGAFTITNSIILPQTENRELTSFGSKYLFELSINGLIVSSIANHLGLPDLFNTSTGETAIGRFGLMDGEGIFANSGLFPPEPSAWEKIDLGWVEPVELSAGSFSVSLAAGMIAGVSDTVILKVPISQTEYYLVENRQRDAQADNLIISYYDDIAQPLKQLTIPVTRLDSVYLNTLVNGIVVDVDEFDAALPGSGIVIWHIDEAVIAKNRADNKINADINNRGVDVEEADGIQDIGIAFQTIFGDIAIGNGMQDDMWFAANPSELFTNEFGKNTRPDTRANNGAHSLITVSEFSESANMMHFNVAYGDSLVKPLFSKQITQPLTGTDFSVYRYEGEIVYQVIVSGDLLRYDFEGVLMESLPSFSSFTPAMTVENGEYVIAGIFANKLNVLRGNDAERNIFSVELPAEGSAAPVIYSVNGTQFILAGLANGDTYEVTLGAIPNTAPQLGNVFPSQANAPVFRIAAQNDYNSRIVLLPGSRFALYTADELITEQAGEPLDFAVSGNAASGYTHFILTTGNVLFIIRGSEVSAVKLNASGDVTSFTISDLKNDGNLYIVYTDGDQVRAVNSDNALADLFPFNPAGSNTFIGKPIAGDIEGSLNDEVLVYTAEGVLYSIDGATGKPSYGFPISTGTELRFPPQLFFAGDEAILASFNQAGVLSAWVVGTNQGALSWSGQFADMQNSSFAPLPRTGQTPETQLMPVSKAYNYPNPAAGTETFIRYYVSQNAAIDIKIFDLAGDYVAHLIDDAVGGMDNETVWDISAVQSGVYLARIEASAGGVTESVVIKIAVVK